MFLDLTFLRWISTVRTFNHETQGIYGCLLQNHGEIRMPITVEKTLGPKQILEYLGLVLNFIQQVVAIPEKKRLKCLELVELIISAQEHKRKVTIKQVQQVAGSLNFICQAILGGHPLLASLYRMTCTPAGVKCKAGHYKWMYLECSEDMKVFRSFLLEKILGPWKTVPFWINYLYTTTSSNFSRMQLVPRIWGWGVSSQDKGDRDSG